MANCHKTKGEYMKGKFNNNDKLPLGLKNALHQKHKLETCDTKTIIQNYWSKARSVPQFKKAILKDDRLKLNKGYALISKERGTKHFYEFRISNSKYFKSKIITPKRCLYITINDVPMMIPNGNNGDNFPITRIAVIPEEIAFNPYMLSAFITAEGDINVFDQNGNIAHHLIGRYEIMFGYSIVAFNKIASSNSNE